MRYGRVETDSIVDPLVVHATYLWFRSARLQVVYSNRCVEQSPER